MSVEFSGFEDPFNDDPQAELNLIIDSMAPDLEEEKRYDALVMQEVRSIVWATVAHHEMWPRFSRQYQLNAYKQWGIENTIHYPAILPAPDLPTAPYRNRVNYAARLVGSAFSYYLRSPDVASPDVHHQKIRAESGIATANLYDKHRSHFADMLEQYIPIHPSIDDTPPEVVATAMQKRPDSRSTPRPWPRFNAVNILLDAREAGVAQPITTEAITAMIWTDRYIGKAALTSCPQAIVFQANHQRQIRDNLLGEGGLQEGMDEYTILQETVYRHLYSDE